VSITAAVVDVADRATVHTIEIRNPRFVEGPAWYGLRAEQRALPLSELGCRALAFHIATTTLSSR